MTAATSRSTKSAAQLEGEPPDRALADRVTSRRDPASFRALYARHTPALYAMAMRLTGEPADAEDAVHDAWIRAVEALPRFEWRSSLRTWLTGILLNRLRELERHHRPELPLDDTVLPTDAPPDLPHDVDPLDLEAAIAALPPGYRRVLVLHDIEGFTHEDIAALLDIEPGTSKSQLSRARAHLRRSLSTDEREVL
ncbi:MAG TPA: RNA polymerase sigma factor [Gemmatimonadaceae bacterium]|nr:RNA polymerase sigma factor [Gemmatimonadaceae bacterium]